MARGLSVEKQFRMIRDAFASEPRLAFAGAPEKLQSFDKLYQERNFDQTYNLYIARCRDLAEQLVIDPETEFIRSQPDLASLPEDVFIYEHPRTVLRELHSGADKPSQNKDYSSRRHLKYLPKANEAGQKLNIQYSSPDRRLIFALKFGTRLSKFSKAHIFGFTAAKQINDLLQESDNQSDLIANAFVQHFHPKLIVELLKDSCQHDSVDLDLKLEQARTKLAASDYPRDQALESQVTELAVLVQEHVDENFLDKEQSLHESLLNDYKQAFSAKIGKPFIRSILKAMDLDLTLKKTQQMDTQLNWLSQCFYRGHKNDMVTNNSHKLRQAFIHELDKKTTKPYERELYTRALKLLVA